MKRRFLISVLLVLSYGFIAVNAKASFTVATFADPSRNSGTPLLTVNFLGGTINGGWDDSKTGLTLQIPYSGHSFTDAWFSMTNVAILDTVGDTSGGEIDFYANNTSTNPLLVINFENGYVDYYNFGADSVFVADNVTITGSEITGPLSEEQFAFSFANLAELPGHGNWDDGFTATASFTSSAVPEPATIGLFGLGITTIICKRRK